MYCLNLLAISLELAREDAVYEDVATKFLEHFVYIGAAVNRVGGREGGLWHDADGYYFDVLKLPDGRCFPIRANTIAGLIPVLAIATSGRDSLRRFRDFAERFRWFLEYPSRIAERSRRHHASRSRGPNPAGTRRLAQAPAHPRACVARGWIAFTVRRALGVEAPCGEPVRPRTRRAAVRPGLPAWRIDDTAVRRQFELARPGVVSVELPADRGAAEAPLLPRRRVQGANARADPATRLRSGRSRPT